MAAYIQASLARIESTTKNVSALGAVMAFLYCTYIVTYAITSPLLGKYIDDVSNRNNQDIHHAIQNVAGVQFTIIFVLVMTATFVPKGAFAVNPQMLNDEDLDHDIDDDGMDYFPGLDDSDSIKHHEMNVRETRRSNST